MDMCVRVCLCICLCICLCVCDTMAPKTGLGGTKNEYNSVK